MPESLVEQYLRVTREIEHEQPELVAMQASLEEADKDDDYVPLVSPAQVNAKRDRIQMLQAVADSRKQKIDAVESPPLQPVIPPLVWTGTCCGHPAPGEDMADAVHRRLRDELGVQARDLTLVLPDFSYRASDGTVEENELCPVFVCLLEGDPEPDPGEVAEWVWWDWDEFRAATQAPDSVLSPWSRLQAPLLDALLDEALPGLPRRRTA